MTTPNDFNDDNDDVTRPSEDSAEADSSQLNANPDSLDASSDPLNDDSEGGPTEGGATTEEPAGAGDHEVEPDVDLPQLLRQVSHVLRREFRSATADSGFDPRNFGRADRGHRRGEADEVVPDGKPYSEDPEGFGPPWARGGRGPGKSLGPEELRQRLRDMRDGVGERVEDVLTSEEFDQLKASLSKIVDAFGPERCGDESDARDRHDHDSSGDHDGHADHGDDPADHGNGSGHESKHDHEGRSGRDGQRRGGRGWRGFSQNFGPNFSQSFGSGFGPGRRGFDPFGWAEERHSREQEVQEAFERGFAAGFEQGRTS